MRTKLKLKQERYWILLIVQGSEITVELVFLDLTTFSANKGSLAKYGCHVISFARIFWLYSNVRSNDPQLSSMTLYINLDLLGSFCVHKILAGSSGRMVSCLHEDMSIWLPQGITFSIHWLQTWRYEIFGYHRIWVPRLNLLSYLLSCLILHPDWG